MVLRALIKTDDHPALLLIRVTVGMVIFAHGAQKLFGWFGGHGPTATIESFSQWFGLPAIVTILVILAESVGAFSLILGFLSRVTAASIALVMVGAIVFVVGRWGFFMNWYGEQRGEGFEFHLLVLGMTAAIIWCGGGRWSVDRRLHWKLTESDAKTGAAKDTTAHVNPV